MKKFLVRLLLFSFFLTGFAIVADFPYSRCIEKIHEPNLEIWSDVMKGRVDADIVILGNSRANTGAIPAIIDSLTHKRSYNLGIIGHPLPAQILRYKMLISRNPRPGYVIWFLDNFSLICKARDYDAVQFYPWFWYKGYAKESLICGKLHFLRACIPFWRYHSYKPWAYKSARKQTEKGFFTYHADRFSPSMRKNEEIYKHFDYNWNLLRQSMESLLAEDVRVAIVVPPLHESLTFLPGDRERMISDLKEFSEAEGIPLFDYGDLWIKRDTSLFLDESHLNRHGADIFTKIFVDDLNNIDFFND